MSKSSDEPDATRRPVAEADLQRMEREILEKLDEMRKRSRNREMSLVIVQVFLGALVGLLVWFVQTKVQTSISEEISAKSRDLSMQLDQNQERYKQLLALSEEFYRQRLGVYSRLHKLTRNLLRANQQHSVALTPTDAVQQLWDEYRSNSLYLTAPLEAKAQSLFWAGIDAAQGTATAQKLETLVADIETQMRSDLHVDELTERGVFTREAAAELTLAAPPATASPGSRP